MPIVAAALPVIAIASVASNAIKANGARKAAKDQLKGIEAGKTDLNTSFDKAQTYQDPYVDAGKTALGQLTEGTKAGGDFNRPFTIADFNADPGYQFRQQQGLRAVDQGAAARGGVLSGAALKGEQEFGQRLASQEYQSAYSRYNNDMNGRFGRLSSVANMGQHAADISTSSEQNRGLDLSNLSLNKGNVNAAKDIAYSNAGANVLNTVANSYGLSQLTGGLGGGGSGISAGAPGGSAMSGLGSWAQQLSGGSTSYGK